MGAGLPGPWGVPGRGTAERVPLCRENKSARLFLTSSFEPESAGLSVEGSYLWASATLCETLVPPQRKER